VQDIAALLPYPSVKLTLYLTKILMMSRKAITMGNEDWSQRANSIHWPPLLYGVALLLPWLLAEFIPLPRLALDGIIGRLFAPVGWAIVAAGVMAGYLALRSFAGAGTPFSPTARAEKLVSFGLYNQTRNPMYLAALVAFFGLAFATGNLWRLIAMPLLFMGLQNLAVLREEQHLEARFGNDWRDYAKRVKRWW
jgi:protein-S-isoprenylcysteine O-methyltransferase Ste14